MAKKEQQITNWEAEMALAASDASMGERPASSRISIRAGVLKYQDQEMPDNTLKCVILASCVEQTLYMGAWDPERVVPPDCFALGAVGSDKTRDLMPHEVVTNPLSQHCFDCPKFQWESAGEGRKGKACSTKRRLVLIPAHALATPDTLADVEIASMAVAVTSVVNYSNYVNTLKAKYKRPPWGAVTNITTKPHAKSQFKVIFSDDGVIDHAALAAIQGLLERANEILYTPFDMTAPAEEEKEPEKF